MNSLAILAILPIPLLFAQEQPVQRMAPEAKPAFDVATIKPATPDERFTITVSSAGLVRTTGTSLYDLIKFAFDLHPAQLVGAPGWLEDEKFDITGRPDLPGRPSTPQMKQMMQKLFVDRLHLTVHHEKKEMTAYVITEAKAGAKIEKNNSDPNGLMSFSGSGQQGLKVSNMTMPEFAWTMQAAYLDRPVLDSTGFGSQRYNFTLKWTPDNAPAAAADSADAPPDIFTAFRDQLGLKLESKKAPVDVMVIDRIERPGEN